MARSAQQLSGTEWHFLWVVFALDAVPTAFLADMLTEKLIRVGMQDAHVQRIPLHFDASPDPPRRQAVIGCFDLHAAIQMYDAFSVLVIAEGFQRQGQQVRIFLGEHDRHLPFRRAMDARVGPAFFPAIQILLRFFQPLEAHPFERRFLRVADP
jgi:hypothetical protein